MTWRYSYTGEIQQPRGTEHPSLCPFELYDAADGQVAIAAPGERHWQLLCETIGRPDMVADPRLLQRPPPRRAPRRGPRRHHRLDRPVSSAESSPPSPDGCRADRSTTVADLAYDPHCPAPRQIYVVRRAPWRSGRPVITPNAALRFTETPGGVYRPAPRLGQHLPTEILAELEQLASRASPTPPSQEQP